MSDPNSIVRWALGVPVIILNAQQAMWETQTVRTMVLQRIVLSFTQCAHDSFLHQLKKKGYNVGELDYSHFCHFKYQPTSCFPPVAKTFFFLIPQKLHFTPDKISALSWGIILPYFQIAGFLWSQLNCQLKS